MVSASNISYQYSGQEAISFKPFECKENSHWLLLGQSGCGKTTLLHMLAGLLKPASGSIEIAGTDITKLNTSKLDHFRGQHIGVVFQQPHFVQSLTVAENLRLAQYLAGAQEDGKRIKSLLESLNLGHKLNVKPKELSQGEQQRVAIARAIVNQPKVILADEPTSALDDTNALEVIQLLETQANEQKATLLIVTHDQRLKNHFPNRIQL